MKKLAKLVPILCWVLLGNISPVSAEQALSEKDKALLAVAQGRNTDYWVPKTASAAPYSALTQVHTKDGAQYYYDAVQPMGKGYQGWAYAATDKDGNPSDYIIKVTTSLDIHGKPKPTKDWFRRVKVLDGDIDIDASLDKLGLPSARSEWVYSTAENEPGSAQWKYNVDRGRPGGPQRVGILKRRIVGPALIDFFLNEHVFNALIESNLISNLYDTIFKPLIDKSLFINDVTIDNLMYDVPTRTWYIIDAGTPRPMKKVLQKERKKNMWMK